MRIWFALSSAVVEVVEAAEAAAAVTAPCDAGFRLLVRSVVGACRDADEERGLTSEGREPWLGVPVRACVERIPLITELVEIAADDAELAADDGIAEEEDDANEDEDSAAEVDGALPVRVAVCND
jgi:hypothetical protein